MQKAQKASKHELESESDVNHKLELLERNGSPGEQLELVKLLARNSVAQGHKGKGMNASMGQTIRETLQKIHDTIETTSLKQVFADHEASKQILDDHVVNVQNCSDYLSPDGLDSLEKVTASLKAGSEACQATVVGLEEKRGLASEAVKGFVASISLCLDASGMDGPTALQRVTDLEAKAHLAVTELTELNSNEQNATEMYESSEKDCSETTGKFTGSSCELRTMLTTSLEDYGKCRSNQVPLLEKEKVQQSEQAELRKRDYTAYKKIQCFIKVMNKTTPEEQQQQLDFCTGEDFSSPEGLDLELPPIPPLDDTSEKVSTVSTIDAEVACPDAATTNPTEPTGAAGPTGPSDESLYSS